MRDRLSLHGFLQLANPSLSLFDALLWVVDAVFAPMRRERKR
jgi:hypothetical protein